MGVRDTARRVHARLARAITRNMADYRRCDVEVVGLVGIGGSPSCRVATTFWSCPEPSTR
jgi:predicted secreted protein